VGGHVEDRVGVDLEGDLNLGDPSGGLGESGQVELTEEMVILGHGPLTFKDLDGDRGLIVLVGGKDLGFLGGDERTPGNDGRHHTSYGLYS